MIVIPKYRLAFLHIPKTAGSSVTAALAPHTISHPEASSKRSIGDPLWQTGFHDAGSMHDPFRKLEGILSPRAKWFLFAVVRDPFTRWYSWYKASCESESGYLGKMSIDNSFEDWLALVSEQVDAENPQVQHVIPQRDMIEDRHGDIAPDMVLRFENLEGDFKECMERAQVLCDEVRSPDPSRGIQKINLPADKMNASPEVTANILQTYDEQPHAADLVRMLSGPDFDAFGYSTIPSLQPKEPGRRRKAK